MQYWSVLRSVCAWYSCDSVLQLQHATAGVSTGAVCSKEAPRHRTQCFKFVLKYYLIAEASEDGYMVVVLPAAVATLGAPFDLLRPRANLCKCVNPATAYD